MAKDSRAPMMHISLVANGTYILSEPSPLVVWTPSAKPSLTAVGTVTTALPEPLTVSYCMSMVRSFRAASASP